jgi:hypothetical protein
VTGGYLNFNFDLTKLVGCDLFKKQRLKIKVEQVIGSHWKTTFKSMSSIRFLRCLSIWVG